MRELVGRDKGSLIGKAKATCASKARSSFAPSHQRAAVQPSPRKQGSIMPSGYSGRQMPSL